MATIRKRLNKWQVQIRRMGATPISRSFQNRKDAEEWARHSETLVDRRDLPADPKLLERITFGQLIQRYRDHVTPLKLSWQNETIVLNAFLRNPLSRKRVSELTQQDFATYRDKRLTMVKPHTLKRELCPLQNLFEVAKVEWGLPIRKNPLKGLRIDLVSNRRERRLATGELEKLLEASQKARNRHVTAIIEFTLETALRRSELIAAVWANIDLENRILTIPKSKNGHMRKIILTKRAVEILHQRLRASDSNLMQDQTVFPVTANALQQVWKRVTKRAEIADLHFHDLRHEAISRYFEMGLTLPEVAQQSGHRDFRMLFRYSHSHQHRILEQFNKRE